MLSRRPQQSCLRWLTAVLTAVAVHLAAAAGIEIRSAGLTPGEDAFLLDADLNIELSDVLQDVVSRGVPLYFVFELEITRPRWYWFDEKVVAQSQTYRLSYHALTRQYRLAAGALHQNFDRLNDALRVLARVNRWAIADKAQLANGENYDAALRMRLDLTQLPKPMQVTALGNRDWALTSDWLRWRFSLAAPVAK